jgi:hypothetical protein
MNCASASPFSSKVATWFVSGWHDPGVSTRNHIFLNEFAVLQAIAMVSDVASDQALGWEAGLPQVISFPF